MTKVEYWRMKRGMTQLTLSARSGVSVGSINRIERHGRKPIAATIGKLAEALEVDPLVLVEAGPRSIAPAVYADDGDIDDEDEVN